MAQSTGGVSTVEIFLLLAGIAAIAYGVYYYYQNHMKKKKTDSSDADEMAIEKDNMKVVTNQVEELTNDTSNVSHDAMSSDLDTDEYYPEWVGTKVGRTRYKLLSDRSAYDDFCDLAQIEKGKDCDDIYVFAVSELLQRPTPKKPFTVEQFHDALGYEPNMEEVNKFAKQSISDLGPEYPSQLIDEVGLDPKDKNFVPKVYNTVGEILFGRSFQLPLER